MDRITALSRSFLDTTIVDGVPTSPNKVQGQALFSVISSAIQTLGDAVTVQIVKTTLAKLTAIAGTQSDGTVCEVTNDGANSGIYEIISGIPNRIGDLPADSARVSADEADASALASATSASAAATSATSAAANAGSTASDRTAVASDKAATHTDRLAADASAAAAAASASALADPATTHADRVAADASAASAAVSATSSASSASIAAAYANAAGISHVYDTYAHALAAIGSIAANAYIQVLTDEAQGGLTTVYQLVSGSLVLKLKSGQKDVRPEYFGALADNSNLDRTAVLAAATWITSYGGELRLSGGKTYYLGTASSTSLNGITIYAEAGSILRGLFDFKASFKLRTPLTVHLQDTSYDYLPRTLSTSYGRPIAEKEVFFGQNDADLTQDIAIDCTTMNLRQVTWPACVWSTITTGDISSDHVNFSLATTSFNTASEAVRGGDQLTTIFAYGEYERGAIIRTALGTYVLYANGMGGSGYLYFITVAGVSTLITSIDWPGRADNSNMFPGYSEWCIDIIDPQHFSVKLNGLPLLGVFAVANNDFIYEVGFGVLGSGGAGGIRWPVLRRNGPVAGRGFIDILTAGDSRVAPYWDDWTTHMGEYLEGALGINVLKLENIGVDGWTTATTLSTILSHGFSGVTHLVCDAYNNDAQNAISLATTQSNILAIIDAAQAANVTVIWVLCPAWYTAASAGQGVITYNDALAPEYRAQARWLSALRGCRVADLTQLAKPILSYEAQASPGDARYAGTYVTGLRDNIHFGPMLCKLIGQAVARVILGTLPSRTRALDEVAVPPAFFVNGWVANTSYPPGISVSADGLVTMRGWFQAGTKTAGTIICNLPQVFWPSSAVFVKTFTDNNAALRMKIDRNGQVSIIDALGSGDADAILSPVSWRAG